MTLKELQTLKLYSDGIENKPELGASAKDGDYYLIIDGEPFTGFGDAFWQLNRIKWQGQNNPLPWGEQIRRESCGEGLQY